MNMNWLNTNYILRAGVLSVLRFFVKFGGKFFISLFPS